MKVIQGDISNESVQVILCAVLNLQMNVIPSVKSKFRLYVFVGCACFHRKATCADYQPSICFALEKANKN